MKILATNIYFKLTNIMIKNQRFNYKPIFAISLISSMLIFINKKHLIFSNMNN